MAEPIAPTSHVAVRDAVARAAEATGVDFSLLIQTAQRESGLNPRARASTSSATGLFQFIDSTWLDMVRRHGAAHGLGEYAALLQRGGADAATRRDILSLRSDPEISARMAAELARDNADALQARLGRAPTAGELYAAHVMGAEGAARLIEAGAQGAPDASALFPREAAANRGLFYFANGEARSAENVLQRLQVDAGAAAPNAAPKESIGPLSPALARALFMLALSPLLRGSEGDPDDRQNPLAALAAYARHNGL
ncbi:MAG TPA: transglycosylase SLT domain-containing protein [Caulobacterales bacterium]|nr:transglycosylase SLT domain-containing protein [Caulobacterales bacterium]